MSPVKLMAAIIFISIGVIASFFCAIVDGIIASEFIVSNRTHLHGCAKKEKKKWETHAGWGGVGRIQSDRPDGLISVSGPQRWENIRLIKRMNRNENSCVTSGAHRKNCLERAYTPFTSSCWPVEPDVSR